MKVSEAVDGLAESLGRLPGEKKTRMAVSVVTACLVANRLPFPLALCVSWLAGAAGEQLHGMVADMRDLSLKQAAYLDALHAKAVGDAAGGV